MACSGTLNIQKFPLCNLPSIITYFYFILCDIEWKPLSLSSSFHKCTKEASPFLSTDSIFYKPFIHMKNSKQKMEEVRLLWCDLWKLSWLMQKWKHVFVVRALVYLRIWHRKIRNDMHLLLVPVTTLFFALCWYVLYSFDKKHAPSSWRTLSCNKYMLISSLFSTLTPVEICIPSYKSFNVSHDIARKLRFWMEEGTLGRNS